MKRPVATVLVVAMLVLAGCSSGMTGASGDETGTVNFYVSDQPSAIDDFDHLNVTLSQVTFVRADGNQTQRAADATLDLTQLKGTNSSLVDEYGVASGDYTKVFLNVSEIDGTLTSGDSADVKLPSGKLQLNQNFTVESGSSINFVYDINVVKKGNGGYNLLPVASESGTDVEIDEVDASAEASVSAEASSGEQSTETSTQGSLAFYMSDQENAIDDFQSLNVTVTEVGFQRGGESGNWTEFAVDDRTVDLTELKGDNATLLQEYDLDTGNYTKVFIHVSEVDGTLTNGDSTDVKLPSSKIQLNENFEIEANATVDFVYDITVVKRGNSGSYNIKPVASESGTDVPIKRVDEDEEADESDENTGVETPTAEADLSATFEGSVIVGENTTVHVAQDGEVVEGATVMYDGTEYTTDANGEVTFAVPSDAAEVEVTVSYEGAETELTATVQSGDGPTPVPEETATSS